MATFEHIWRTAPRVPFIIEGAMNDWPAMQWDGPSVISKIKERPILVLHRPKGPPPPDPPYVPFSEGAKAIFDHPDGEEPLTIFVNVKQRGDRHRDAVPLTEIEADLRYPSFVDPKKVTELNVWFGRGEYVTTLHCDMADNLFSMVRGFKRFIMFAPEETRNVHPHSLSGKTGHPAASPFDPENVDAARFPRSLNAKYWIADLERGDMLFMPRYTWHHVRSKGLVMAINLWFEGRSSFFVEPLQTEPLLRYAWAGTVLPVYNRITAARARVGRLFKRT